MAYDSDSRARWGVSGALKPSGGPAIRYSGTELSAEGRSWQVNPPGAMALKVGSSATVCREPGQVRKEAAISELTLCARVA